MPGTGTTRNVASLLQGSLEVRLLGCVDFDSALYLQQRLVHDLAGRSDTQGGLLLCEHPPLITVGREGSRSDILVDTPELTSRQMEVRWLNRGGGCCVHAPGQLAVYPILPFERLHLGLDDYRQILEESVIAMCRDLHVPAWRFDDEPGVWCRLGQFTQIGVAVQSGISHHGMFINVSPAMQLMRLVQWSAAGDRVTSLAAQRERRTPMHIVREGVIRHLTAALGYERSHIYTGHPLLRRSRRMVNVASE